MGGKNKGQDGQTQTTTSTPWGPQAEQLKFGFNQARDIYDQGPAFAPFSDVSQTAIGTAQSLYPQVGQQLGATIGGEYLGANPYLDDVVARSSRNAMSGINATFGGAGRTGGGLHQQALATGLGDVAAGVYAPAYEAERQRQLGTAMQAPSAIQGQLGTGAVIEGKDLEEQLAPYTNLQRYMSLVGSGNWGGTQATTGPGTEGRGALAGAAGGAMAGAALGPYGALAGGVLGG